MAHHAPVSIRLSTDARTGMAKLRCLALAHHEGDVAGLGIATRVPVPDTGARRGEAARGRTRRSSRGPQLTCCTKPSQVEPDQVGWGRRVVMHRSSHNLDDAKDHPSRIVASWQPPCSGRAEAVAQRVQFPTPAVRAPVQPDDYVAGDGSFRVRSGAMRSAISRSRTTSRHRGHHRPAPRRARGRSAVLRVERGQIHRGALVALILGYGVGRSSNWSVWRFRSRRAAVLEVHGDRFSGSPDPAV